MDWGLPDRNERLHVVVLVISFIAQDEVRIVNYKLSDGDRSCVMIDELHKYSVIIAQIAESEFRDWALVYITFEHHNLNFFTAWLNRDLSCTLRMYQNTVPCDIRQKRSWSHHSYKMWLWVRYQPVVVSSIHTSNPKVLWISEWLLLESVLVMVRTNIVAAIMVLIREAMVLGPLRSCL